jgi:Ca2+-binding EF-hand superfamily protein
MDKSITKLAVKTFNKYDTDKSGFLERSEVKELLEADFKEYGIEVSESAIDVLIGLTDKNNDGKISKEEYIAMIKQGLERSN